MDVNLFNQNSEFTIIIIYFPDMLIFNILKSFDSIP